MQDLTPKELRQLFGQYPTGVTIVTTKDEHGNPFGMTANSFVSVSLSPPLISWCIDKDSSAYDIYAQSSHFAVHFLSVEQKDLSDTFAMGKREERFDGVQWTEGTLGSPILPECVCVLECEQGDVYSGGDHSIILGHVLNTQLNESREPLLFHRGSYKTF